MANIFGDTRQIAYVSADLDGALGHLAGRLGVGPWFVKRDFEVPDCHIDGVATQVVVDAALAYSGGLQLEVIVQKSAAPTLYSRFLERFGDVLVPHSTSSWVSDVDAVAARAQACGFRQVFDACTGLGRIAYFEHPDRPHFAHEVTEYTPARQSIFRQIQKAAADWDGNVPIREDWPIPDV
ncbi:VOC family protein [Anianabacter salinae]|uniref:VOC family protein n=1 Tax=Anianabacter salinae TaxID=2851023 RepID=UPI00225E16F9|nr:VOC family protein [Anianabacter salinae]